MAAIVPNPNIGSQIERALIAYFYANWPVPTYPRPQFYFSNDWKDRIPPLIDVLAHKSAEEPVNSRDENYIVSVRAKWPGSNQPGQSNLDYNWKQINDLIGIPMALLSQFESDDQNFRATAMVISGIGRRLYVLGTNWIYGNVSRAPDNIANNSDMSLFTCLSAQYMGAVRMKESDQGIFLVEERNWKIRAFNSADDSIFPALSFDGSQTLNWAFTIGGIASSEPNYWLVEKSVDGVVWMTQQTEGQGARSANISATGTQYWRVRRSNDGVNGLDPESNVVKAIVT